MNTRERIRALVNRFSFGASATQPKQEIWKEVKLGTAEGDLDIVSFAAGGFDGVLGLGVVHAYMVSGRRAPDVVTGISTGAVAAVVLAEVLCKEAPLETNDPATAAQLRDRARVARFREVLKQVQQLPEELWRQLAPDPLEFGAPRPLQPLNTPLLPLEERAQRTEAVRARHGVLRLINGVLSSRMKLAELTRIVRLVLEVRNVNEWRYSRWWRRVDRHTARTGRGPTRLDRALGQTFDRLGRWARQTGIAGEIWSRLGWPVIRNAPLVGRVVWAWIFGSLSAKIRHAAQYAAHTSRLRRLMKWIARRVLNWTGPVEAITILMPRFRGRAGTFVVDAICQPVVALGWLVLGPFVVAIGVGRWAKWRGCILALTTGGVVLWGSWKEWHEIWMRYSKATSYSCAVVALALIGLLAWLVVANRRSLFKNPVGSFLSYFDIRADLATSYVPKLLLVRAFDPNYFGAPGLEHALAFALGGVPSKPDRGTGNPDFGRGPKRLMDYLYGPPEVEGSSDRGDMQTPTPVPRKTPMLVLPVAANVGLGDIETLHESESVVEALSAATALVPIFRAQSLEHGSSSIWQGRSWFIDGWNVSPEPHTAMFRRLRELINETRNPDDSTPGRPRIRIPSDLKTINLWTVSPLPVTKALDEERRKQLEDTLGQAGIDADRIHPSVPSQTGRISEEQSDYRPVADYRPVDMIGPMLRMQRLQAAKDERVLLDLFNYAMKPAPSPVVDLGNHPDGTKWLHLRTNVVPLELSEPPELFQKLLRITDPAERRRLIAETVADGCRLTLETMYEDKIRILAPDGHTEVMCRRLSALLDRKPLPGSEAGKEKGPGTPEVCRHCALNRSTQKPSQMLQVKPPISRQTGSHSASTDAPPPTCSWPREHRTEEWPAGRPTISLIFAGGVFRGVFQIGVVNALNELDLRPDLVAGASVGSIVGAITTSLFERKNGSNELAKNLPERRRMLAMIAASFLAIDRLVLTDRFADFIRRFSLRAGDARFSLRDIDGLFRQYDRGDWDTLNERSRKVLAGLHRLVFLDPAELMQLVQLSDQKQRTELGGMIKDHVQEFLTRSGVGEQLLGTEPLELLIREHVLHRPADLYSPATFELFVNRGMQFLATASNVSTERLDVLSALAPSERLPNLVPGLLASSAFPFVFRPRWSWEIRPVSPTLEQYVDGGVTDNLPLAPVSRYLYYASMLGRIAPRPTNGNGQSIPHLLLTGSLEVTPKNMHRPGEESRDLGDFVDDWYRLNRRAGRLRHNKKVDRFSRAQADFRAIQDKLKTANTKDGLLDLHLVCVKPQRLCGTFGFHPMLGFTRADQAASIAHGCASTLARLFIEEQAGSSMGWTPAWWKPTGVRPEAIKLADPLSTDPPELHPQTPRIEITAGSAEGLCWFRLRGPESNPVRCPFSPTALAQLKERLESVLERELAEIYWQCGKPETHRRRD